MPVIITVATPLFLIPVEATRAAAETVVVVIPEAAEAAGVIEPRCGESSL